MKNFNMDRKSVDGRSKIEESMLASLSEYEVIKISMPEFEAFGSDQLAKINYLIKSGKFE